MNIKNINTVTKTYNTHTNQHEIYMVTLVDSNVIISVPLDPDNTDYQEIQEWAKIEGNNIIDPGA